jgi:hypothetical protein
MRSFCILSRKNGNLTPERLENSKSSYNDVNENQMDRWKNWRGSHDYGQGS